MSKPDSMTLDDLLLIVNLIGVENGAWVTWDKGRLEHREGWLKNTEAFKEAKQQITKLIAEIIGADNDPRPTNGATGAASNAGTVESMFWTSRKDLRFQQRQRAKSMGIDI